MTNSIMKILCAIIIFLSMSNSYALSEADINHTLHVYLNNMTSHDIRFDSVIANNPGNAFSVSPSIIPAGETGVITVEKRLNNDIDGRALFIDSNMNTIIVSILDQEQIHYGQPIFSANGATYYSLLAGKTRNKSVGPRYLTYLAAEIQLLEKTSS